MVCVYSQKSTDSIRTSKTPQHNVNSITVMERINLISLMHNSSATFCVCHTDGMFLHTAPVTVAQEYNETVQEYCLCHLNSTTAVSE